MYHLVKFVKAIFGNQGPKKKSLVCDVVPSDATPRGWKIQATEDLTITNEYPEYCNGMAYLMTSDLIPEFLKASNEVSILCILLHNRSIFLFIKLKTL